MRVERNILKKEEAFWWRNILVPLFIGLMLYEIAGAPYLFGLIVDRLYGPEKVTLFGHAVISEGFFTVLMTAGRDFFWGYALTFAVCKVFRRSLQGLKKAFGIVFTFEILMIIWRFSAFQEKIFELQSPLTLFAANMVAGIIILLHRRFEA